MVDWEKVLGIERQWLGSAVKLKGGPYHGTDQDQGFTQKQKN